MQDPPHYPPQGHPWQGAPVPPAGQSMQKIVVIAVACVMVLLVGGVVARLVWFPPSGPHTGAPQAGSVKYRHSGIEDGSVSYPAGITNQDGKVVGDYLREAGWFSGGTAPPSRVYGMGIGSYGLGSSARGYGRPLATLERDAAGLRVIVYTSSKGFASEDVQAFASDAQRELTTRFGGKHVTFVVRLETKQGAGLAWKDLTWE